MSSYHPSLCPSYGMRKLQHCSAGTFQWDIHAGVCPMHLSSDRRIREIKITNKSYWKITKIMILNMMTIKTPLVYFQFSDN